MRESVEHLVIGGGPAGSMMAIRLAAAGREVMLLEKEPKAHHKVCGEFLSHEAVTYLKQVEIDPRELGAGSIDHIHLLARKRAIAAPLPFSALSLSRYVLDEKLLERAVSMGCKLRRGAFVERLEASHDGWLVHLRNAAAIKAKSVFLATGKHDLNGQERGSRGTHSDLVGFKMHWKLPRERAATLNGVMKLFLFTGGYGGISMVEGERANLCLVVKRDKLRQSGGWPSLLDAIRQDATGINDLLCASAPLWEKPLAISPIPYGYIGECADGVWRIGDQAAVIPSFTGDGMSIAMHSAALAAEMYLAGKSARDYAHCLRGQLSSRMRISMTLSRLMVTPYAQIIAPLVLTAMPRLLAWIAGSTRIPARAIRSSFGMPPTQLPPAKTA